jgi:hypothetical protein
VAWYLSKHGHERLGLGNQDQTFNAAAAGLGVKKTTLKNHRDRFDPFTGSGRRGWWQKGGLPAELVAIDEELRGMGEMEVRERVLGILNEA